MRTERGRFDGQLVVLLVALIGLPFTGVWAGDYANDWPHVTLPSGKTGEDMALVVVNEQEYIGVVATGYESGNVPYIYYYVKFPGAGFLGAPVCVTTLWNTGCAIAYDSDNMPHIVFSYMYNANAGIPNEPVVWCAQMMFVDSYIAGDGSLAWYTPVKIDEQLGSAVATSVWPNPCHFTKLRMYFDKRPGYEDEIHVLYTGLWFHLTEEEAQAGEDPDESMSILANHLDSSGAWSGRKELAFFTNSVHDVCGNNYVSLAVSEGLEPQAAYFCGGDCAVSPGIKFAYWDDVTSEWIPLASEFLEGENPWLAVDPLTGLRHVAYERYVSGARSLMFSSHDGATWGTPVSVKTGSQTLGYSEPRLGVDRNASDGLVMQILYTRSVYSSGINSAYVVQQVNGTWQDLSQWTRVSYKVSGYGQRNRLILSPDSPTSPWVLTTFEGQLITGVAWYAQPPGGCSSGPLAHDFGISVGLGWAIMPLLLGGLTFAVYYLAVRRRRSAE